MWKILLLLLIAMGPGTLAGSGAPLSSLLSSFRPASSTEDGSRPIAIRAVSAGGAHTCVLASGGRVRCWGRGSKGQTGDPVLHAAQSRPELAPVIQLQALRVVAGREATCLVTLRRGLRCFGINDEGRLGTASDQVYTAMPTRIHGILADATSVALGDDHACALNRQGGVQCWGAGGEGQLGVRGWYFPGGGDGARLALRTLPRPGEEAGTAIADDLGTVQEDRVSRTPLTVDGLATGAMQVAAGAAHSCAVTSHGRVLCWGSNAFGQLGDGSRRMRISPVDVSGLDSAVTQVALGATHSCALTSDGSVQCWGSNGRGELGDGSTQERLTPGPVNGLGATAVQITAGAFHTCALLSTGAVKCWGYDHVGQLGDGGISNSRVPVAVRGLPSRILQISAGAAHTCALADSGALYCWGDNRFGQLGTGLAGSPPNSLVAVKARAPF